MAQVLRTAMVRLIGPTIWACLLVCASAGCSEEDSAPSPVPTPSLSGTWQYTFSTQSGEVCPQGPGFHPACAGGGTLEFVHEGQTLTASYGLDAGCENCAGTWDYGTPQAEAPSEYSGTTLTVHVGDFVLTAEVPDPGVDQVDGIATGQPGVGSQGTWRMTRAH